MQRRRRRGKQKGSRSSPLDFVQVYSTSEEVTKLKMPAEHLIARIRTFAWDEAYIRLCILSSLVANAKGGPLSEAVKAKTVDPLLSHTGPATQLISNMVSYVRARRESMVVAHEEALNYLQHLVILEGADSGDAPSDAEVCLWLIGINDHIDQWQEADTRVLSSREKSLAAATHCLRFNKRPDMMSELVRASTLYAKPPVRGELADPGRWATLQFEAFGAPFDDYYQAFLFVRSPREVTPPGLPQIPSCGTTAMGSSDCGFTARPTGAEPDGFRREA
jgi:hypothetical protein